MMDGVWDKYGIKVKCGRLLYDDVRDKILKVKDNSISHLINVKQKHIYNKKAYISGRTLIKLLVNVYNKATVSFCAKYLEKMAQQYNYPVTISKQQQCKYSDFDLLYFVIGDIQYYKAKNVCNVFGYVDTNSCISRHISDENKIIFKKLLLKCRTNNVYMCSEMFFDVQTIFITKNGITELIFRSQKSIAIELAKYLGINVHQKITRKEIDIVYELDLFCKSAGIKCKHSNSYSDDKHRFIIDYYFPDYKLAIEIDEYGHSDRDPKYEKYRQEYLMQHLGCTFIRCNPDDHKFTISGLIGKIHKHIINHKI